MWQRAAKRRPPRGSIPPCQAGNKIQDSLTLVMIRGKYTLVMIGGGGGHKVPPPTIFIYENNRKSNKIMHCVEKKKLSGSFEDKAIFHVILEIDR